MEYTVTLRTGNPPDDWRTVRSNKTDAVDGAISLIEGFTELATAREGVTWQSEETDDQGMLYGQTPDGSVWNVYVQPPVIITEQTLDSDG